jgi:hypothetical protein
MKWGTKWNCKAHYWKNTNFLAAQHHSIKNIFVSQNNKCYKLFPSQSCICIWIEYLGGQVADAYNMVQHSIKSMINL